MARKDRKTPIHEELPPDEFYASIAAAFKDGPDRGFAVVMFSLLDDQVSRLLIAKLKSPISDMITKGAAPLGSFKTRIDLLQALSLTSNWMHRDLMTLRDIRNRAAHDGITVIPDVSGPQYYPFSFNDESINDKCSSLNLAEHYKRFEARAKALHEEEEFARRFESLARARYFVACNTYCSFLIRSANNIRENRKR